MNKQMYTCANCESSVEGFHAAQQVNDSALAKILIAKGIMTEIEYTQALAEAAEEEAARYEKRVQEHLGTTRAKLG